MKTTDRIRTLTDDMKPLRGFAYGRQSLTFVLMAFGVFAVLSALVMPFRPDLNEKTHSALFLIQTSLFLLGFAGACYLSYRSSIPGEELFQLRSWEIFFLGLAAVVLLAQFSPANLKGDFFGEMDLHRGRCGPIIFSLGTVGSAALLFWLRRGASTEPSRSAFWAGIASGCFGLFLMQFICDHENFFHILIWHFVPVVLLASLTPVVGRRFLRW